MPKNCNCDMCKRDRREVARLTSLLSTLRELARDEHERAMQRDVREAALRRERAIAMGRKVQALRPL